HRRPIRAACEPEHALAVEGEHLGLAPLSDTFQRGQPDPVHVGRVWLAFPPMISTNQFKNGTHIDVEGKIFKIVEFQHVKPGKGPAFVRTKLKRTTDGAVIDKTFRAGEKFRPVRTETRRMQFLYGDGADAHFMDSETFEQFTIPQKTLEETLKRVLPSEGAVILYVYGPPT